MSTKLLRATLRASSRRIGSSSFRRGDVLTVPVDSPTAVTLRKDPAWTCLVVGGVGRPRTPAEQAVADAAAVLSPVVQAEYTALVVALRERAQRVRHLAPGERRAYGRLLLAHLAEVQAMIAGATSDAFAARLEPQRLVESPASATEPAAVAEMDTPALEQTAAVAAEAQARVDASTAELVELLTADELPPNAFGRLYRLARAAQVEIPIQGHRVTDGPSLARVLRQVLGIPEREPEAPVEPEPDPEAEARAAAIAQAAREELLELLAGELPLNPLGRLHRLAREAGITVTVEMLGATTGAELAELLRAATTELATPAAELPVDDRAQLAVFLSDPDGSSKDELLHRARAAGLEVDPTWAKPPSRGGLAKDQLVEKLRGLLLPSVSAGVDPTDLG